MKKLVLTEPDLAARIHKSGILRYFRKGDIVFYTTDIGCYACIGTQQVGKPMLNRAVETGTLVVVESDERQWRAISSLYSKYSKSFTMKTVAAVYLAGQFGYRLVTDDAALEEMALKDFGVTSLPKNRLTMELVEEIALMGIVVDLDLINELI